MRETSERIFTFWEMYSRACQKTRLLDDVLNLGCTSHLSSAIDLCHARVGSMISFNVAKRRWGCDPLAGLGLDRIFLSFVLTWVGVPGPLTQRLLSRKPNHDRA